jgi:hypothetical protein
MFRYKLRTLMIVLAIGPPWLAVWFWGFPKTMTDAVGIGIVLGIGTMFMAVVAYRWLSAAGLAPDKR